MSQNLSSAAVVIAALRVNAAKFVLCIIMLPNNYSMYIHYDGLVYSTLGASV